MYKSVLSTPQVHKRGQESLLLLSVGLICLPQGKLVLYGLNLSSRKKLCEGLNFCLLSLQLEPKNLGICRHSVETHQLLLHSSTRTFSRLVPRHLNLQQFLTTIFMTSYDFFKFPARFSNYNSLIMEGMENLKTISTHQVSGSGNGIKKNALSS